MGTTGGGFWWGWNVYPAPSILYPYFINDIIEIEPNSFKIEQEIVPIERKLK